MGAQISIQRRLFPQATCFGCGPANAKGLRLESFARDGVVVARFAPWPEHDNGLGFLNGGIIATVLDCHSGAAVFDEAATRDVRAGEGLPFPFVTAGLDIRFRRPVPLGESSDLRAYVTDAGDEQMTVVAELWWDGRLRAQGTALWRRWRPRTTDG